MDFFKVGGVSYDVVVTNIVEDFTILYSENTGRTMSAGAKMSLDPLGTFFAHKVTVKRKRGAERDFDDLLDYISTPRSSGIEVEIVHNQSTIKYEAYVSNGSRQLSQINKSKGVVEWGEITINFVPMEAQIT
jgi:hypothetical protein